jgi:hypothetical protein
MVQVGDGGVIPILPANYLPVELNSHAALGNSEDLEQFPHIRDLRYCPGFAIDFKSHGFHDPSSYASGSVQIKLRVTRTTIRFSVPGGFVIIVSFFSVLRVLFSAAVLFHK